MHALNRAAGQIAGRIHGGPQDDEIRSLGIDLAQLLDFSVNTNPYGPCPAVVESIRAAAIDRYPDPTGRSVREAMAQLLGLSPDEIALGNGAAELLWTLVRALLHPGAPALVVEPTFCEFRAAASAVGAQVFEYRAHEADQFLIDLDAVARMIRTHEVQVVYLCLPNTPTGVVLPAVDVATWAEAHPQTVVILDQSFLSLCERFEDADIHMPPNVVRVRSLTKDHAIPGVRVGYIVATPEIVARVEEQRPAWSTSSISQAAALVACREHRFVEQSRRKLLADRTRMISRLRGLDLSPLESTTPFFLVRVAEATELRMRLLARHHILVRDCASFDMPDFIRLAARPEPDCERLVAALKEELRR
jgi:histidinol-phosphate aminotransferase